MSLQQRAIQTFDDATGLAKSGPAEFLSSLAEARARVGSPMRVAVVGRVKAGKSTLMNALLEGSVAPTGPEELTYNVNWFVHAEQPAVTVYFRDGTPPQSRPIEWLERLVTRTSDDVETLSRIGHVQVGLPRDILSRLELIDTPGFGSFFNADSQNTLRLLGMTADDVDAVTLNHAVGADALVYLFARGLAMTDTDLVTEFQGVAVGDFTPVNAIAVLTKVDAYWSIKDPDKNPLELGASVAHRLRQNPTVERMFFDVVPLCGLLAAGASSLSSGDVKVLAELAEVSRDILRGRLQYADRFARVGYDDLPVPPALRAGLIERLGQYGIWVACEHIRSAGADLEALRATLLQHSGLPGLRDLLLSHFGARATLIKTASAVNRLRATGAGLSREVTAPVARQLSEALGRLEAFEVDEHDVAELSLLRALYRDEHRLGLTPEEVREVLSVTGEFGPSCAGRLRRDDRTPARDLLALAEDRVRYWRRRADQFGLTASTVYAVRTVQRSYERITHHLRIAIQHLEMDT